MSGHDLFIGGAWRAGSGPAMASSNPATGEEIWTGHEAGVEQVDSAVAAARAAFEPWAYLPIEDRIRYIEAFKDLLGERRQQLALTISRETGRPLWESDAEIDWMIGKVAITRTAYDARTPTTARDIAGGRALLTHRPHGVMAVFGPYNFPGHLPNGHIVPALLAGNTVVFKPSRLTPFIAELMAGCWHDAGLPDGVVNLLQGTRIMGAALAGHAGIDGLLFTGSSATGTILHRQFGGHPEKILALEMGGNNPLIAWDFEDLDAAAVTVVLSAYLTAGQRCTCARRLIVPEGGAGDRLIDAVAALIPRLKVGPYDGGETPFMGPLISNSAADRALSAQRHMLDQGGEAVALMRRIEDGLPFLSPGLIDVTAIRDRADEEHFAPLLQVIRVADFDAAIREANTTAFGLSAGLLSEDAGLQERFHQRIRAGIVNWNRPTTGASGTAPFGGTGASGDHRPGALYAADYCAYPVASLVSDHLAMPAPAPPGIRP